MKSKIRLAKKTDRDRVLEIRNEPHVIKASINQRVIAREDHSRWWDKYFNEKKGIIYIVHISTDIIAFGRLDYVGVKSARLSLCVSSRWCGKKIGSELLLFLVRNSHYLDIEKLHADIRPENLISKKMFSSLGFKHIFNGAKNYEQYTR